MKSFLLSALLFLISCGGGGGSDSSGGNGSSGSWVPISSVNVPSVNDGYSWVWTGTETIIWGGERLPITGSDWILNSGARYNPSTNEWKPISRVGTPAARRFHSAVWTGKEMIVWGGMADSNGPFNDGGIYDSASDTWRPISTVNAPPGRLQPGLVWTGTEMIVWNYGISGGIYNPETDSWRPMSGNTLPRASVPPTCWTGTEMLADGWCRYNPSTDTWRPMNKQGEPDETNAFVCTNKELIVYGSLTISGIVYGGARYDYANDQWTPISAVNSPSRRKSPGTVWTGTEMWIVGGYVPGRFTDANPPPTLLDGSRYNPTTDTWTSTPPLPTTLFAGLSAWTGTDVIFIWTGVNGIYHTPSGLRLRTGNP